MFCTHCGEQISDEDLICIWCGKVVKPFHMRKMTQSTSMPPGVEELKAAHDLQGLTKALSYYGDDNVRIKAARALGQMGDPQAVAPLIAMFKNANNAVRSAATEALVKIGAPALEPLITVLGDADRDVREASLRTLERLGWKPDKSQKGAAYWIAKGDWEKCAEIGAPAVESIVSYIHLGRHVDEQNWKAAVLALGKIGTRVDDQVLRTNMIEELITILRDRRRKFHGYESPSTDMEGVEHDGYRWDMRGTAVLALEKIGDACAIEPLTVLLNENDEDVRRHASEALDRLGWKGQT